MFGGHELNEKDLINTTINSNNESEFDVDETKSKNNINNIFFCTYISKPQYI